jgi:Flp pilus assembly protein TadG
MHIRAITSRLSSESGQAAIEFALLLPVLAAFIFLVADFARGFNAYNDLNQMAADGARLAAVGNFPGASTLLAKSADTKATKTAAVCGPIYLSSTDPAPAKGAPCPAPGTCAVGKTVWIRTSATVGFIPSPIPVTVGDLMLEGKAEMRVERCPTS